MEGITQYNLHFDKLCELLNLGALLNEPMQVTGGLIHRMYIVEATSGKYAVKALNPRVMLRPNALKDIINGERIATIAARYIPTVHAKQLAGGFVHETDGQYYLVYEWIDGQSLYNESITPLHCERIGEILGDLHSIDFSCLDIPYPANITEDLIDWNSYLQTGQQIGASWVSVLSNMIDEINNWNRRYLISMKYMERSLVIGHGDIDPKNVMWCNGEPVIIDWESAGFLNPAHEFIVDALYWSDQSGEITKSKFEAFIKGYQSRTTLENVDWRIVMDAGLSPHWLEYSIKRSLGIDCSDSAEQQMGTEQIYSTITYLKHYDTSIPMILDWLP